MSETFAMTLERLYLQADAAYRTASSGIDQDPETKQYWAGVRDAYRHAYRMEAGLDSAHRGLNP